MQKVGFFKSIHVKIVLIYILLILLAMQIIGLYFARELEHTLKDSFTNSIEERVDLVEFSVRTEMRKKERGEADPTLEQSLRTILYSIRSEDINEIRVIDNNFRILATSETNNQSIVGQRSTEPIVRQSISSETSANKIRLDPQKEDRIWVLASPIVYQGEVLGTIYLESNIETVF
ncbi:MAG: cell wall metabolism sensor histidine kinase WalK, partial [Paenisporosarcina sp.]|nr:cell wall metabolism sensor histidine kinase WalK [Paenisporosarcina sp.]